MSRPATPAISRFMAKVIPEPNSGCWLWSGSTYRNGYGVMLGGESKHISTHRFSWAHFKGDIPDGAHVLHKCDVRCCVNPEHLFLGDQQSNMDDMARKGRRNQRPPKGSLHPNHKLTEKDIVKIRNMYVPRIVTYQHIADMFGVTKHLIILIVQRKAWKHVS